MAEKEVFSSVDEIVVSRLCDILDNQGISYIRKDGGAGSYLSIKYGQDTLLQKKIFVSEEDFEKARDLIDFLEIEGNKEENIKALRVIPIEDEFGYVKYYVLKFILGILLGTIFTFIFIFIIAQIIFFARK